LTLNESASKKIVSGDEIGFFFGAGASIEFGISSMKQMTKGFAKEIKNKDRKEAYLFRLIYNSLENMHGKNNVDLEAIMSVIIGLKEKERPNENIGDLGLFILKRKGIIGAAKYFKYDIELLNKLEKKFQKFIRKSVFLNRINIDKLRKVYSDFFNQICAVSNCSNPNSEDSNLHKNTFQKWTFFTTNYDNALEEYWINYRKYVDLDLGFKRQNKIMAAEEFVGRNLNNTYGGMQLVKLHGSVNWMKNKERDIEEYPYNSNYDRVKAQSGSGDILADIMIYPLSQKQLYFTPFIQLFRILEAELNKRKYWIVIGYSFRDMIIRTMFEKALAEENNRQIILVHPHAQYIKKLFQNKLRDQIISLEMYFGKENYGKVNKDVAESLLKLEKRAINLED
jgi:hypothetical protein